MKVHLLPRSVLLRANPQQALQEANYMLLEEVLHPPVHPAAVLPLTHRAAALQAADPVRLLAVILPAAVKEL